MINDIKTEDMVNNSTQPHKQIPTIWKWERKKCVIDTTKLIDLLDDWNIGILNEKIVHRENGILTMKESKDVKDTGKKIYREIYNYYMDDFDEDDFLNPMIVGVEKIEGSDDYITKLEVRTALIEYKSFNSWSFLNNQFTYNKNMKNHPKKSNLYTPLFRDNKNEVFTFFNNGVVKTTKDGSELREYEIIKDGYIWENQKRTEINNISLMKDSEKGVFEEFVEKCMSVQNENGEWEIDEKEYEALRTTYGYLLSNYTNNGETPAPIFVDRESDGVHAEGGNGKSLVMKSIKHWKNSYTINGRNIHKDKTQFTFSGTPLDSEFVFMDDVDVDFPFNMIYNYTTGDMEIERKHTNKFVIDESIKPKIGVCTNYIMSDTSHSTKRRQYVIEFGNFWNFHDKQGISVEKYLGKRLIDNDFTDNDWIQFYNFGFRCIQEFLTKGVVETEKSNYERKQYITKLEGNGVNDGVVDWIENYIKTEDRVKDCVQFPKFISDFNNYFDIDVTDKWDKTRLKKVLWDICLHNKWDYNPHRTGNSLSDKRWKTGPKGQQFDSFKIIVK